MAYDVTLVQFTGNIGGLTSFDVVGLPHGEFTLLVCSMWVCLQPGIMFAVSGCDIGPSAVAFNLGASSGAIGSTGNIGLTLSNLFTTIYSAQFAIPIDAPITGVRSNVLLSVNTTTQTVQVYVNDQPLSVASGGWLANRPMANNAGGFYAVDIGSPGGVYPAIADLYNAFPNTFFDLSVEANRRKFINADLTPVYLGLDGSLPGLGIPPVYLTVPSGGVPNDLATNFGSGGPFGIGPPLSFQTPGTCHLPAITIVSLTGVSATGQVGSLSFATSIWAITSNIQTPSTGAVGDVWANDSYIDFSDPTVRATFENADGSWLDLGYNGATPTGSSPLLYLTVQLQQPPSDILKGYGQGGAQTHWSLLDQGNNPSTGQAYAAMSFDECATASGNLELTDIALSFTSPVTPDEQVTLRWSDDAGASWSNGLLRSMGQPGEYFTSPTWYRLGMSRNRIIELSWSGARAEALQGVFLDVSIAAT